MVSFDPWLYAHGHGRRVGQLEWQSAWTRSDHDRGGVRSRSISDHHRDIDRDRIGHWGLFSRLQRSDSHRHGPGPGPPAGSCLDRIPSLSLNPAESHCQPACILGGWLRVTAPMADPQRHWGLDDSSSSSKQVRVTVVVGVPVPRLWAWAPRNISVPANYQSLTCERYGLPGAVPGPQVQWRRRSAACSPCLVVLALPRRMALRRSSGKAPPGCPSGGPRGVEVKGGRTDVHLQVYSGQTFARKKRSPTQFSKERKWTFLSWPDYYRGPDNVYHICKKR